MADNSVTIYGVADVGLEQVEAKGAAAGTASDVVGKSRVTSNSSYIGFKGQEELGGSLKAIWQIEQAIDIDDGGGASANGFATRDSFVGLSSAQAGTVVMGRLTTPTRAVASKLDVFPGQAGIGADSAILGNTGVNANSTIVDGKSVKSGGGSLNFDTRKANAVGIVTPTIAGMNATVAYIANEGRTAAGTDPWGWGAGLNGTWGPVTAMFAYEEHRNTNGLNGNDLSGTATATGGAARGSLDTNYRIGLGFSQAGLTVNAIYEMLELRAGDANAMNNRVTELARDAFWIGGKYALGNHEFRLAYAMAMKADATKNYVNSEVADSDSQQISVGYGYNFSKRTQVYGVYSTVDNKNNTAYDFGPSKSRTGAAAGADPEGFSIGVRHLF
jgi:predicted porin